MKVSIVTAILNSQEIVRRQMLHYKKMDLPDDVEIIFIDDGSIPPLNFVMADELFGDPGLKNFRHYATNNFVEWTQPAARNFGCKKAIGEYLLCTDIDHIFTRKLIEFVRNTDCDVVRFRRQAGVLDEYGNFTQDMDVLKAYGLMDRKSLQFTAHGNSFAIKRELYFRLGGVSEKYVGTGKHPNREEVHLKKKLNRLAARGEIKIMGSRRRPIIYMFPNGRFCGDLNYNPFGLFHNLKRMTRWESQS